MSSKHFIEECVCGVIIAQCRCPSPDKKVTTVMVCTHTKKQPEPSMSSNTEEILDAGDLNHRIVAILVANKIKINTDTTLIHDMTNLIQSQIQAHTSTLKAEYEEKIREARIEGIKLVDEALLDDVTGFYPVAMVRNLIKMLIWENTPTKDTK